MRSFQNAVFVLCTSLMLFGFSSETFGTDDRASYPRPSGNKNMLFYIQRTLNTNTIIYELNTDANGELIKDEPIKFYYKNYANHGEIVPVSSIQKQLAYGISIKLVDAEKKTYSFYLNACKSKQLFLMKSPGDKQYHVFCNINNQLSILDNVFVIMKMNMIGYPNVESIEISGKSTSKNLNLTEAFKPE
jgi:hypothetical protein